MIITLFLTFIASIVGIILSIVPTVTVAGIPIVGGFVSTYLTLAVGYWVTAEGILPYIAIVREMLIYVILPFEFTLLIIKVFFGSRMPTNG